MPADLVKIGGPYADGNARNGVKVVQQFVRLLGIEVDEHTVTSCEAIVSQNCKKFKIVTPKR